MTSQAIRYTLGLDIGIASVGWAVLKNGSDGDPYKIENLGVRIFYKAEVCFQKKMWNSWGVVMCTGGKEICLQ